MFQNLELEKVIEAYGEEKTNELATLIKSSCEILKVPIPKIWFCDHVILNPSKNQMTAYNDYTGSDLKRDANIFEFSLLYGTHFLELDNTSTIMVSIRDDDDRLSPLSHVIFITLHELRHSWQRRYGFDSKDKKRYAPYEDAHKYLNHPIEIDADAFSALILEQCTEYRPYLTWSIINMRFDKKRINRMKELKKEYFPHVPNKQRAA